MSRSEGMSEEEWQGPTLQHVVSIGSHDHHHMILEEEEIAKELLPTFLSKKELKPG